MNMEYSFSKYLLSKQSVDDRALNRNVLDSLKANLPGPPIRIIEVGAGIGTMLARILRWEIVTNFSYVLIDEMQENIETAQEWIPRWAAQAGLSVERIGEFELRIFDKTRDVEIQLICADVFDFLQTKPAPADLLIAHAFLDLLPMPEGLPKIFALTNNLAWLTINFDGVTSLEPTIDNEFDKQVERFYHATMDKRSTGGDSRTGRHFFSHLQTSGAQILAAGASDWVVYPTNGKYPAEEAYFLHFILHFIEESLTNEQGLDATLFGIWLKQRRAQIDQGELIFIAHQMDLLARV
jgi:hypothetical protein